MPKKVLNVLLFKLFINGLWSLSSSWENQMFLKYFFIWFAKVTRDQIRSLNSFSLLLRIIKNIHTLNS